MRRRLPLMTAGVLGILSLYLFWQGARSLNGLERAGRTVSVVCREGVSAGDAWELLEQFREDSEEGEIHPVFWREREEVQVSGVQTGTGAVVRLLDTAGDAELLFAGGSALAPGDTRGCLIDRETARELFGYGGVIGQALELEGETYEIRGVLEGQKGILVVQRAKDSEVEFDTVTAAADGKRQDEIRELLTGRFGIQGTSEEWNLLYGLAKGVLLLFPLGVAAAVLAQIRGNIREASGGGERIFWKMCFWGGLLGSLCCIAAQIHLPSEMIPSTWSDFDFWANLWGEKRQAVSFLLEMKKRAPEISYSSAFYKSVIFGFLSLLLYFPTLICYTYYDRLPSGDEEGADSPE